MIMDSKCDTKEMNVERDRLSSLPDNLIHKILAFVSMKHVVETSLLSSRWRFMWTSMPYLNFSSDDFASLPQFSEAVAHVLSRRDGQIEVESLVLSLNGKVSRGFAKRVLNYAFSHNVQRMTIRCLVEEKIEFPLSLFRSRSLKHLTLIGSVDRSVASTTWELPALTTLHLGHVTLYCGNDEDEDDDDDDDNINIIAKCPNLKTLTLDGCKITGSNGLSICHPRLSNLTLENGDWAWDLVHVVAPHLKKITIVNCDWVHLSAPSLTSFIYRRGYSLEFSAGSLPSLEEVDLCIRKPRKTEAHTIFGLLQKFHGIKCLTINLEALEVVSSSVELISNQPSPFANLKKLNIYPVNIQAEANAVVSNEVKNYLLGRSPSASFTMVTREEIKANDTTLADHLMAELRVILDRDKANINWDHLKRGKSLVENYWEDLEMHSRHEKTKICDFISKLKRIESLLTKLPTSNRAKMQSVFDGLCADAKFVMKKVDLTNTHERLLSVCSDELAKALQWSSKQV
ncbi:F-box/LRR-repeat protein At1g55660-like [Bidens hawaiensis]|uniref:F-box/LRR-repeat protein At1g55660-like n=1 Tax=Bidens hawaiensis TaxID=980011 RepID=UPI00404AA600